MHLIADHIAADTLCCKGNTPRLSVLFTSLWSVVANYLTLTKISRPSVLIAEIQAFIVSFQLTTSLAHLKQIFLT